MNCPKIDDLGYKICNCLCCEHCYPPAKRIDGVMCSFEAVNLFLNREVVRFAESISEKLRDFYMSDNVEALLSKRADQRSE